MSDPSLMRVAELAEAGLAAASLVHEIRQPVFAIKALAQLAGSDGISPAHTAEVLAAIAHLEELLEGWSGVGRHDVERPYELGEVTRQVVRMMAGRSERVGATITLLPGSHWVVGRPGVARQVAMNLIQNALDAVAGCDERQVTLQLLTTSPGGLEVVDTGRGLPDGVTVTEPFVTTKGDSGTGLGLYVCESLCAGGGGALVLDSPERGGLRVRATFAHAFQVEAVGPMKNA